MDELSEKISGLIDEKNITDIRKQAEKRASSLTTDQWKYLRKRAKWDLFFLSSGVLGYNKLSVNLHGNLCSWMMRNSRARFREILLPRSHYKTTVATISDGVRIALPDDSGEAPWPECLGTNCRILIGHEALEHGAAKFLVSIAGHFLSNPVLMGLFPECVPSARKQRINKYELELPRTEIWNEPTYDTMGVGGRNQGRHYNFLKLDDLIGDKARDSATEMESAKLWIDNIQAFFSNFLEDKMDIAGTRWAFDDLYAHLHEMYGPALIKYIRGAEEWDAEQGKIVPIFPEAFSSEAFEILKRNPVIWSAQYANNPEIVAKEFDPSWKKFYEWRGYNKIVVFGGDSRDEIDVMDMDRVILIDPAMSGLAGYLVTGSDWKDRVFTLKAKKHTWKPPELVDEIFADVSRWQPRVVAIEEVLFSGLFKNWLEAEMRLRGIYFKVVPVKTGGKSKPVRVRGLSNYFAAGNIYFHQSQNDLITEFDTFGATSNYHMLDALAYGPDIWTRPLSRAEWQSYQEAEMQYISQRDAETGY